MGERIERFVPVGQASLVDDAPGWSSDNKSSSTLANNSGPICWKCRGTGQLKLTKKLRRNAEADTESHKMCSVCKGTGHLPPKKEEALALQNRSGEITRPRTCPKDWKPRGPIPWALDLELQAQQKQKQPQTTCNQKEAARLVHLAESTKTEIAVQPYLDDDHSSFDKTKPLPQWLPQQGEQLCNLVGSWRILQRVASHRWTTDDLVTSYMAGRALGNKLPSKGFRYLDLGCGNGSVLLMTTWQLYTQLLQQAKQEENKDGEITKSLHCAGIEARHEAVQLARRSIDFNLGDGPVVDIQVHHGDFRSILNDIITDTSTSSSEHCYDLVTGTPPYFRVDFTVEKSNDQVVQAVIQQGGMPTCKQSAPARCEFRGGVEAYCQAASTAMHTESLFCVCENWLNNDRVYQGAKDANLVVTVVLPVQGRSGKPCPLFAVYVMRKRAYFDDENENPIPATKMLDTLIVRDSEGNWTQEYKKVLEAMSIPVI